MIMGRCVVLFASLSLVNAQEVLVGSAANFDTSLKEFDRVLVKFYAPWCGHCKSLAPEFEKAAQQLHESDLKTKLMKVDATIETELASRFKVEGYPKLTYFSRGGDEGIDYDGGRTADTIVAWLRKRELPPFQRIDVADEEKFLAKAKENEFSVVGRLKKGSVREKAFKAALESLVDLDSFVFHNAVSSLPKSADAKKDAALKMRRPGFEKMNETEQIGFESGAWTSSGIRQWLIDSSYPLIDRKFVSKKHSPAVMEKLGFDGIVVAVLEDSIDDDEDGLSPKQVEVRSMFVGIAPRFPKWKFVATTFSDVATEDQETIAADSDGSISVLLAGDKKYQLLKNLQDTAIVSSWLDDVQASKAKRYFKSATPPAEPVDADGVLTLTGQTFNEYVMNPKKDVFVEFYAPWCGHCKQLEPIFSKMARTIKQIGFDKKGVVVAKMDATENQCEEEVSGFPKLVLYPAVASKKKFRSKSEYVGTRELEDMMDFLMELAVNLDGVETWTTTPTTKKKSKKKGSKTEL